MLAAEKSFIWRVIALAGILTVATVSCVRFATFELVDDAYISLRYAQHLNNGQGLVFNPGERVEGYTDFLWVLLLAAAERVGWNPVQAARWLGGSFAVLAVSSSAFLLRRDVRTLGWRDLLAPALLAGNLAFAMWATRGLETALFTVLLVLAVRSDLRTLEGRGDGRLAGLWYALAALTRPEAALLFGASQLAQLASGPRAWWNRRAWRGALVFFAIVGPHELWRLLYYGHPFPNTFYAKSGLSLALVRKGLDYVGDFFSRSGFVFLLLVPALIAARRDRRVGHLAWMVAAYLVVVVLEGGDFFGAFRFLVPLLPLLYALLQEGVARLAEATRARRGRLAAALVTVAALALCVPHQLAMAREARRELRVVDEFTRTMVLVGTALRDAFPPGTTVAANPVGAISYVSGFHVLDLLGLTNEHIGHAPAAVGTGIIGHEKGDGGYVFERRPDLVLIGNVLVNRIPPQTYLGARWPTHLKSEREFVNQEGVQRWYGRDSLRLADGRYLYMLRRRE